MKLWLLYNVRQIFWSLTNEMAENITAGDDKIGSFHVENIE